MNYLAQRFHTLRNQKRLTQEDVASRMRVSQSTYSKLENGTMPITEVHTQAFAKALGIEESLLLSSDALPDVNNTSNKPSHELASSLDNPLVEIVNTQANIIKGLTESNNQLIATNNHLLQTIGHLTTSINNSPK